MLVWRHSGTGNPHLNPAGEIVYQVWNQLPHHFPKTGICEFVLMPNHLHGIVMIGEGEAFAGRNNMTPQPHDGKCVAPTTGTMPGSLGAIIQNFKVDQHPQNQPNRTDTRRTRMATELL